MGKYRAGFLQLTSDSWLPVAARLGGLILVFSSYKYNLMDSMGSVGWGGVGIIQGDCMEGRGRYERKGTVWDGMGWDRIG
jgi:hypothetical protein